MLCATLSSVQANEAIKLLTGIGDPLVGRLLIYDALELSFKDITVRKDPECAVCGKNPTVTELIDYEEFCGVVSDQAQEAAAGATITPAQLKALLDDGQRLKLVDVPKPAEWQINRLPRATLIPLDTLPDLAELPQTEPVVLCTRPSPLGRGPGPAQQSGFSMSTSAAASPPGPRPWTPRSRCTRRGVPGETPGLRVRGLRVPGPEPRRPRVPPAKPGRGGRRRETGCEGRSPTSSRPTTPPATPPRRGVTRSGSCSGRRRSAAGGSSFR